MMPLLMLNRFVPLSIAGLLNDLASHWPSTSEDIRQTYKDSTVSSVLLLQEKQTGDISHFEHYCLAHAPEVHMSAIQNYIAPVKSQFAHFAPPPPLKLTFLNLEFSIWLLFFECICKFLEFF